MNLELTKKRPISNKGQICIPVEFRKEVKEYVIRESTDEQGRECLKLYPVRENDSNN